MKYHLTLPLLLSVPWSVLSLKVVVSNDDGWATAIIRAEVAMLRSTGHQVILSAPAINKSGSGRSSTTPTPLEEPCQFDTCAAGSPAVGNDANDQYLNYVNAFPVDAMRYGIQTLAPKLFGGKPELAISGCNVGNNLGPSIIGSGTVGAAAEAVLQGIPAIAISAATAAHVSSASQDSDPNSKFSRATRTYNTLTQLFLQTLLANPGPAVPPGAVINLNYPGTENCPTAEDISFVFTRIAQDSHGEATDVETCGSNHLPDELATIRKGCYATVSVYNATTITDVDAATQGIVLDRLEWLMTCVP